MKLEFSRQTFKEYSSTKFHQNLSGGSGVVSYGQTDVHDEAKSRFRNFAKVPKESPLSSQETPSVKCPKPIKDCRITVVADVFPCRLIYRAASALRVPASHSRDTLHCTT